MTLPVRQKASFAVVVPKTTEPVVPAKAVVQPKKLDAKVLPAVTPKLTGESASHAVVGSSRFSYGESLPKWDVMRALPIAASSRLSAAEKTMISAVVDELRASVQNSGLSYVPVFGYLSLRKDNFRELGKSSQAEVVNGRDTVEASLADHDIDVVASTIYRGTPEHPGVVAGLGSAVGRSTPGTLLKIPLDRAEELLSHIFHREYFAEDDLSGQKPQAMYRPVLREVKTASGETVKALVFVTNDDSAKAVNRNGVLGSDKLTVEQMAWFMGANGGFEGKSGRLGGASRTYWENSYLAPRRSSHEVMDPTIGKAIELSKWVPSPETTDYLAKNALTEPRAMQALEVVLTLFQGAAIPIALKSQQRAEQALVRSVEQKPVDVQAEIARYLALAPQLLGR